MKKFIAFFTLIILMLGVLSPVIAHNDTTDQNILIPIDTPNSSFTFQETNNITNPTEDTQESSITTPAQNSVSSGSGDLTSDSNTTTQDKLQKQELSRTEITSMRKDNCRFYKNEDGTVTAELQLTPNNTDTDTSDTSLSLSDGPTPLYKNKSQRFTVEFPRKLENKIFDFAVQNSTLQMSLGSKMSVNKNVTARLKKDTISYSNYLPSTDFSYKNLKNGVKESIILKDSKSPTTFSFLLNASHLKWAEEEDGRIAFTSLDTDKVLFYIEPAYATDDKGNKLQSVKQTISSGSEGLILNVALDSKELAGAAYPITIDPTITLSPDDATGMDTYLEYDDDHTSYYEEDYAPQIDVYTGNGNRARGLIKFDLSTIPMGNVSSASIKLYSSSTYSPRDVYAYRVSEEWLESEADWTHREFDTLWSQAGGSYASGPALFTESAAYTGYLYTANITSIVNGWVRHTTPNNGLILIAEGDLIDRDGDGYYSEYDGNSGYYFSFYSSNYGTSKYYPQLVITYTADTTAPTTRITAPSKNSTISGNVNFTATASDSYGIERVEFYANNQLLGTDSTSPYQYSWNTGRYPNGVYTLQVKAFDLAGNQGVGTDTSYNVTINNVLSAPTNLTAQMTSDENVSLTWTGSVLSGVTYRVYRDTASGFTPTAEKLIAGGLGSAAYIDQTALTDSTTYYYRVTAVNADGTIETAPSTETSIIYNGTIQAPLGLTAASPASSTIVLSWNAPATTPDSYVIYRDTSPEFEIGSDKIIDSPYGGSLTIYTDNTGLTDGTSYYYKICARDANGDLSPPSNEAVTVCGDSNPGLDAKGIRPFYNYAQVSLPQGEGMINMGSGNLVISSTDSLLTGNKLASTVRRTYNSLDKADGPFGYGWSSNIYQSLTIGQDGNVVFNHGDGYQETFTYDAGSNSYQNEPGSYLVLTKNQDGSFTLVSTKNITYHFDQNGVLTSLQDLNGNTITYNHGANQLTIQDTVGRNTVITLDGATQRILSVTDQRTTPTQYSYDADGNLATVTDPMGYVTCYRYDDNHNLTEIISPAGTTCYLAYDAVGHIVELSDGLGNTTELNFNLVDGESEITDPLGNTNTFTFDPSTGIVSEITDPLDNAYGSTYDSNYNLNQTTNPKGVTTTYTYDEMGNVLSQETSGGSDSVAYSADYNNLNLPTSITRPNNTTIQNSYDSCGNLTQTTDSMNYTTTYQYDQYGRRTRETNPRGGITRYAYDSYGNLTSITDAGNYTNSFTYNSMGCITSSTDPLGNAITYTYDDRGRLTRTSFPDGGSINNTIDGDDRLTRKVDQLGGYTYYAYDAAGRLISITDPLGGATSYEYDEAGNRVSEEDPSGVEITNSYDPLHRLESVTDELGYTYSFEYDEGGNMTDIIHPLGHAEFATYDYLNRTTTLGRKDSSGNILVVSNYYTYDDMGNLTEQEDALHNATSYQYDDNGRMISTTDALGNTTTYTYDACGNRLSVTNPAGYTTTYTYNALNQITQETLPDSKYMTWTYDAAGRVAKQYPYHSSAISYTYDSMGRLLSKPGGGYTYDKAGKRLTMASDIGATRYRYDSNGRLIKTIDGRGNEISYTYDSAGRRTSLSTDFGTITYEYDAAGNLEAMTDFDGNLFAFLIDDDGKMESIDYPNGGRAEYTYNDLDQTTYIDCSSAGTNYNRLGYEYDLRGNRISIDQEFCTTVNYQSGPVDEVKTFSFSYAYDNLNRVVQANKTAEQLNQSYEKTYTYDNLGNRLTYDIDRLYHAQYDDSYTYTYDNTNRVTRSTGTHPTSYTDYTYDGNGNQIQAIPYIYDSSGHNYDSDLVHKYTYDSANRLTKHLLDYNRNDTNDTWETYNYNADDQVVEMECRVDDGNDDYGKKNSVYYLYDGEQVIADLDGTNTVISSYTWIPGGRLLSIFKQENEHTEKRDTYYFYTDVLGSVVFECAKNHVYNNPSLYDEFGSPESGGISRFSFTGAPYFAGSGLYQMGARFYNPEIGRFITRDTYRGNIYQPWTQNLYTYCNNNPINFVDPTGHSLEDPSEDSIKDPEIAAAMQERMNDPNQSTALLQAQMGVSEINPCEVDTSVPPPGTSGFGVNAVADCGTTLQVSVQVVADNQGNSGLAVTVVPLIGGGTPCAGVSVVQSNTNAASINDLNGQTTNAGGSATIGAISVGEEWNSCDAYTGQTTSIGGKISPPVEVHATTSYTKVISW